MSVTIFRRRKRQWIVKCEHNGVLEFPTLADAKRFAQATFYQDGGLNLQVRLDGQTAWLPQRLIADLFQVTVPTVNEHLKNIYEDGELDAGATIRKYRIVQTEGARQVARLVDHGLSGKWRRFESPKTGYVTYEEVPT